MTVSKPSEKISLYCLLTALSLLISACQQTENLHTSQQQQKKVKQNYYLQVLKLLQSSDQVVPERPDMHPVRAVYNREAVIPPQCYTQTEGKYNPCYVCHQNALPGGENVMNDRDLQEAYSFSEQGMRNHWQNLFEDRSARVADISDAEILAWIDDDNYTELAPRLKASGFKGWIPDLKNLQEGAAAFDRDGFAKDGSHWVAFNYKPFPSTFWPTNGSTDDVMIRLSKPYRTQQNGEYSRDVYQANLAIVEANIKGLDTINVNAIDERNLDEDLNRNGILDITNEIIKPKGYVGAARGYFFEAGIYPKDTEFLHTVRYLGVSSDDKIIPARRMKEVRYMRKWQAYPKAVLAQFYLEESYEKELGQLPGYTDLQDHGLDNGMGWSVQGFIENRKGRLRVNSFEENLFCMGCHGSIGSTIDKTFSLPRKVNGAQGWTYINLVGMSDAPSKGETQGEIATYLQRVGGGSEFRSNLEMQQRFFNADGSVNLSRVSNKDVYDLITPSVKRALALNKAYKLIVEDQDFLYGRDVFIKPPKNIYQQVNNAETPTLPASKQVDWDIRLDWDYLKK